MGRGGETSKRIYKWEIEYTEEEQKETDDIPEPKGESCFKR